MSRDYRVIKNELAYTFKRHEIYEILKKNPQSEEVLKDLFPGFFKDSEVFATLGSLLRRKSYPNNVYALFKWNGEVRLLCVNNNSFFKGYEPLRVGQLVDPEGKVINNAEFKNLIGVIDFEDFEVIERDEYKKL